MINIIKNKLSLLIAVVFYSLASAGTTPGVPTVDDPKNPIDMYVYVLMAVAVIFIAIFAKKRSKVNA